MSDLRQLAAAFPRAGRLEAIWLWPARGVPARPANEALAISCRVAPTPE